MRFTGERFIVGQAVGDIVIEHMQRYRMAAKLAEGRDVLDVACGEGYGSSILAGMAQRVTGVDISPQAVAYAREHYAQENLQYVCASAADLPVADASVDLVVSFETIEHIDAVLQRQFLSEIRRVLRPGGILLMSSPDKRVYSDMRGFQNPYHVHELYAEEFSALLAEFFPVQQLFTQGIGNQRVGVIEPLEQEAAEVRLVNDFLLDPMDKQYLLALCSDRPLLPEFCDALVSVMPFVPESPVRVFVDDGSGISEDRVVIGDVTALTDGSLRTVFSFGEDWPAIERLRFDPLEGQGCFCRILSLSGAEGLEAHALNAFDTVERGNRFLTSDPQYGIEGDFSGCREIVIHYVIEPFPMKSVCAQLTDLLREQHCSLVEKDELLLEKDQLLAEKELEQHLLQQEWNRREQLLRQERDQREQLLQNIYASQGYRLLRRWYQLRDRLLPQCSRRRLLVKLAVHALRYAGRLPGLLRLENMTKAMKLLRHGGFSLLMLKLDSKLRNVPPVVLPGDDVYADAWLDLPVEAELPSGQVFDIVVPIYNAYEFTRKCLSSVYAHTTVPFELYLVDDCSPDERIREFLDTLEQWERPAAMRGLHILHNAENLGFIGSVNRGIEAGQNPVVLLNTDTEVPAGWLERLTLPLRQDVRVASVTPFSNSATICSFPVFPENNDLPDGLTLAEVDALFAAYGETEPLDVPTGVGFCMLLSRQCLTECGVFDPVYGKGYGEENDWCRRAAAAGYRNVQVRNLFVYHKHGASFAERPDKKKEQRMAENLAILLQRYPDYQQLVESFVAADPGRIFRSYMEQLVRARQGRDGILLVNHSLGGGTKLYQDGLIAEWRDKYRVYGLELLPDGQTLLFTDYTAGEPVPFRFRLGLMDVARFSRLLEAFRVDSLYVNQLISYPLPDMVDWLMSSGIPYRYFAHDFYAVCPHFNLLDAQGVFCGAEQQTDRCNACLQAGAGVPGNMDIESWRALFGRFLQGAAEVLAPSRSTAEILQQYYPVKVTVREHQVLVPLQQTFLPEFAQDSELTVSVVGAIDGPKGIAVLEALLKSIRGQELPIRLKVIGITNTCAEPYQSKDGRFSITGPYVNKEISQLLARERTSLVFVSSVCPETFSYTTSEAMGSGYPVLAFDLGAPAERIRRYGCGWVIRERTAEAVLAQLQYLLAHREEICERAAATAVD